MPVLRSGDIESDGRMAPYDATVPITTTLPSSSVASVVLRFRSFETGKERIHTDGRQAGPKWPDELTHAVCLASQIFRPLALLWALGWREKAPWGGCR